MPCIQCDSGKWKWGERGRCIYNSKADCEAANEGKASEANEMNKATPEGYECRNYPGKVELRQSDDGKATIVGVAAVFDSLSENLGGFKEQIMQGAFDDADLTDVRGLFNHDPNFVLGRTRSDTLELEITKKGLEFEIELPDTQTIRDLVLEPIKRGDIDQASFGFIVAPGGATFDENEDGVLIRSITKFQRIFDVSPVTFPAFQDTQVGEASFRSWEQQTHDAAAELIQRKKESVFRESFLRKTQVPGL
jgi:HK97 family phage prohead protease